MPEDLPDEQSQRAFGCLELRPSCSSILMQVRIDDSGFRYQLDEFASLSRCCYARPSLMSTWRVLPTQEGRRVRSCAPVLNGVDVLAAAGKANRPTAGGGCGGCWRSRDEVGQLLQFRRPDRAIQRFFSLRAILGMTLVRLQLPVLSPLSLIVPYAGGPNLQRPERWPPGQCHGYGCRSASSAGSGRRRFF